MLGRVVPEQIWIFGSHARGDPEDDSDVDLLCIAQEPCQDAVECVAKEHRLPLDRLDIAFYTRNGIESLAATGSLFAWHLRREGKPIFMADAWLESLLSGLRKYVNHLSDLQTLITLLDETALSLDRSLLSRIYDMGIVSTAIRNAGIIVSDFLGNPDYSPYAPFTVGRMLPALEPPFSKSEYSVLLLCRRASERNVSAGDLSSACDKLQAGNLARAAKMWLSRCTNCIEESKAYAK